MQLNNNRELYDYLVTLSAILSSRGADELSSTVATASRHATGMSTEFLGEARIALRRFQDDRSVLTESEWLDLVDVLRQLDQSFYRRG
jgi:hypothetical protein